MAEKTEKAKALIPPPGSEERDFWLEAAIQHGFEETSGGEILAEYDPPAFFATQDEVLALMASARQQGRDDAALASSSKWTCNGEPEQPSPDAPGQPIATAPINEEVFVYCGEMRFRAKLVPGASMTMDEEPCDQWQATREGEHPPCWSDGCCWASNEDENASLQPTRWSPAPTLTPGA